MNATSSTDLKNKITRMHSVNYNNGFIDTMDCRELDKGEMKELKRVCEFSTVETNIMGWGEWTHVVKAQEPSTFSTYYYFAILTD